MTGAEQELSDEVTVSVSTSLGALGTEEQKRSVTAVERAVTPVRVTVLPVSVAAIFDSPNAAELVRAYSSECLVPSAQPQPALYEAMERAGSLKCFAAYVDDPNGLNDGRDLGGSAIFYGRPLLIGFISVLNAVVPHDGHRIGTIESVFVYSAYRYTTAWNSLLVAAEQYATEIGCHIISCGPRVGSRLDKILARRPGYKPTHIQHTKWLIEPPVQPELMQIELERALGTAEGGRS
jgi:hypothetical protein